MFKFVAFLGIGVVFMGHSAAAQQLDYKRYEGNGFSRFSYTWLDQNHKEQKLKFALNSADILTAEKEFKRIDMSDVRSFTERALRKYARKFSDVDVDVSSPRKTRVEVKVSGRVSQKRLQEVMKKMTKKKDSATQTYLSQYFYRYATHTGRSVIIPDHGKITKRYVTAMQPVAKAMRPYIQINQKRKTLDYMLSFWQSIPYDTLTDRYSTNGAGFQTPYGVISGNKGDCDSKSVAFAALVRNIYPRSRLFLIYTDTHAFIAAELPAKPHDMRLTIDNTSLVLMEPVGPAVVGVGVLSPESEAALRRGQYSYQEIPF